MASNDSEGTTSKFKYNDSSSHGLDSDDSFTVVTSRKKRRQQERGRGGPSISPAEALRRAIDSMRADRDWLAQCTSMLFLSMTPVGHSVDTILARHRTSCSSCNAYTRRSYSVSRPRQSGRAHGGALSACVPTGAAGYGSSFYEARNESRCDSYGYGESLRYLIAHLSKT